MTHEDFYEDRLRTNTREKQWANDNNLDFSIEGIKVKE